MRLCVPCAVEYVHTSAQDQEELPEIRELAGKTWQAMRRTAKAGQRRTLPDMQEIDALFKGTKQNAVVYFLDETFEELQYDASTTVMEAVEQLAGQIKLENYQTFSLFGVAKVGRHVVVTQVLPLRCAGGSPVGTCSCPCTPFWHAHAQRQQRSVCVPLFPF